MKKDPILALGKILQGKYEETPMFILSKEHKDDIGEISYLWNDLHTCFLSVFSYLVDNKNMSPGLAIWHSIASDKGQREMLVALAKTRFVPKSKTLSNIIWSATAATELSGLRNAAIHTPMAFRTESSGEMIFTVHSFGSKQTYKDKLEKTDRKELFRLLKSDMRLMIEYVSSLFLNMLDTDEHVPPLRERPSLQSPLLIRQGNSQKPPRPPKQAQ